MKMAKNKKLLGKIERTLANRHKTNLKSIVSIYKNNTLNTSFFCQEFKIANTSEQTKIQEKLC